MRYFYTFVLLLCSLCATAQPLQNWVEQQLNQPVLQGAWWGGFAEYSDGKTSELFAVQADTRFAPASTLKLLTTAAALHAFGPYHRFETKLYATANPSETGTLKGDLIIRGGGDMTLGSKRVPGAETYQTVLSKWVRAVKEAGIRKVDGNLYADVSIFEGPAIANKVNWENMGNYYAAPASALCFNDNSFAIHFKGERKGGQLAQLEDFTTPNVPGLSLQSFVTTDAKNKKDNAYVYGAPDQYDLKIFGTIPTTANGFTIRGALPNPALFALQMFKEALIQSGIEITGEPQVITTAPDYNTLTWLYTYQSPQLKDIVLLVNKRSVNLYADMLLRHLALANGQKGSIQNGLAALNQFLRKNNLAGENDTVIYDGSGLSRDTMVTPRVLVNTLRFMANGPYFEPYYNSLATPDDRGDLLVLRRFLKSKRQVENVRIKGGTIDGVKAVAGYVHDKDGKLVAFALMANNLATNKDESLWRIHENIIKKLLVQPESSN